MTIDREAAYLAAARAYCVTKFRYPPGLYAYGEQGAIEHMERDARSTAEDPWLQAVVDAVLLLVEEAEPMTVIRVPDTPKMIRETLCAAQVGLVAGGHSRSEQHLALLQRLIDECDRHRPLGPDGKHGNRHTPTCGCEDK